MFEPHAAAGEYALKVFDHLARLSLDSLRVRRGVRAPGERHLAGDEHPAVGLDRVAERRHRIGRASNVVESRHACSLSAYRRGMTGKPCRKTLRRFSGEFD